MSARTLSNDPSKLTGKGDVPLAIGVVKGRVHIELPAGNNWVAMDPDNARVIAEALAKAAYEAHYGVKPGGAGGASAITDDIRLRCINRVAMVAGSLAREGKSNQEIATKVVDVLLPMIL